MLSVWLQRRKASAATLVFENRIAVDKVICRNTKQLILPEVNF
jgi:hypothetical protein